MTLIVDVTEVAARLAELLAEAEAGRRVVILRGTEPVAKIEKAVRVPKSVMEEWLMRKEEDRRWLHDTSEWM